MEDKEKIELSKIGIVTLLGLAALVLSIFWLKGHKIHNYAKYTFYFKNINGLEEGAPVRWNGLKVGVIESVEPVFEAKEVDTLPGDELIKLGKENLKAAEKALKSGKIENLALASEKITEGQLQIAMGQSHKNQSQIQKGEHVAVTAAITLKDLPISYLNQVTIVPSGLIGEQFLDISTLYHAKDQEENYKANFIVLEPIRLDNLIRVNLESAESLRNLTNRVNALFTDEDAANIRSLIGSFNSIASDQEFKDNLKGTLKEFKDISIFNLLL